MKTGIIKIDDKYTVEVYDERLLFTVDAQLEKIDAEILQVRIDSMILRHGISLLDRLMEE